MDDTTISPSKRRALAPLDANALSPKPTTLGKQHSPLRKRAVEASAAAASPRPEKKTCLEVCYSSPPLVVFNAWLIW